MSSPLDLRRSFRNRFEYYYDTRDSSGTGVCDGSQLTLLELCGILEIDSEPFPRHYDANVRELWGRAHLTAFEKGQTYGAVPLLLTRILTTCGSGEVVTQSRRRFRLNPAMYSNTLGRQSIKETR